MYSDDSTTIYLSILVLEDLSVERCHLGCHALWDPTLAMSPIVDAIISTVEAGLKGASKQEW